jgi:hypothetical protein
MFATPVHLVVYVHDPLHKSIASKRTRGDFDDP